MKKFKLNAILASILSLGVACSSSAFAFTGEVSTPELPKEDSVNTELTRQNALMFDFDESLDESGAKTPELPFKESKGNAPQLQRQNARIFGLEESSDESGVENFELSSEESEDDDLAFIRKVNIDAFLTKHEKVLDELLQKLEGLYLAKSFPQSVEDFAKLLFSYKSKIFLDYLKSEITRFSDEHREDISAVMFKIYLIAREPEREFKKMFGF